MAGEELGPGEGAPMSKNDAVRKALAAEPDMSYAVRLPFLQEGETKIYMDAQGQPREVTYVDTEFPDADEPEV